MNAENIEVHDYDDKILNREGKPSLCYACGTPLRSLSLLVCADCLGEECEKFATLTNPEIK